MYFLLLIFILAFALLYLIYYKPLKVYFLLDSDEMKMMATMTWMKLIKAQFRIIEMKPHIDLYFNGRRIHSKARKKSIKKDWDNLRALSLQDTKIKIFYGLLRPDLSGMFYAAANFIASLADSVEVNQYPEYLPLNEYLRIEAETNVDIGNTLINLLELKFKRNRRRDQTWTSHT